MTKQSLWEDLEADLHWYVSVRRGLSDDTPEARFADTAIRAKLEAYIANRERAARIDELENLRDQTRETTHPDAYITATGVARSIRVHTNSLLEYRIAELQSQGDTESDDPVREAYKKGYADGAIGGITGEA